VLVRTMNAGIELLKPILTVDLFPKLDGMLLDLLRSLAPEDWEKQTVSPRWKVKDVAAHLLDTALRGVHVQDHALRLVAYVDQLGRMLHPFGPGHLAHVYQAFNPLFQFDKSAVVGHAQSAALHPGADGIALRGVEPWVRRKLLEPQRYAKLFRIEFQDLHLDLVANMDQVARMRQAAR